MGCEEEKDPPSKPMGKGAKSGREGCAALAVLGLLAVDAIRTIEGEGRSISGMSVAAGSSGSIEGEVVVDLPIGAVLVLVERPASVVEVGSAFMTNSREVTVAEVVELAAIEVTRSIIESGLKSVVASVDVEAVVDERVEVWLLAIGLEFTRIIRHKRNCINN